MPRRCCPRWSGADPGDPATAAAAYQPGDYTAYLDPGALAGARIGVWRRAARRPVPPPPPCWRRPWPSWLGLGADLVDPVDLPGADQIEEPELAAMLTEFRHDLNAYLAALPGEHPATLAELIAYNT